MLPGFVFELTEARKVQPILIPEGVIGLTKRPGSIVERLSRDPVPTAVRLRCSIRLQPAKPGTWTASELVQEPKAIVSTDQTVNKIILSGIRYCGQVTTQGRCPIAGGLPSYSGWNQERLVEMAVSTRGKRPGLLGGEAGGHSTMNPRGEG